MPECLITGTVTDLDGNAAANARLTFTRLSGAVIAFEGEVRRPNTVSVQADNAGAVSFTLVPGNYRGVIETDRGSRAFNFGVPDQASANFVDLLDGIEAFTPFYLAQAKEYRDQAEEYAQIALASGGVLDVEDVADLLANTTITYTAGSTFSVSAGSVVRTRAEGFAYEVAASGASDHHVTTAGGVKLYVLPSDNGYNVKAFGAKGDNSTNDTGPIQACILAAVARGGVVFFPAGKYVTSGNHSLFGVVGKTVSFLGEGSDASIIMCSSDNDVLTVNGTSQFSIKEIGFDKQTRNKLGNGLTIKNTAYALVENVAAFGFLNGFYCEDTLTTAFVKPLARLCDVGMFLTFTTLSRPNAITLLNPSLSLNDRFGLRLNQPATLNVIGGSIEGNGWGHASFHGGVYISNAGTEGGVGVVFDGVHMEQNKGEADIYIAASMNAGTVYSITNCSIFPIDNTNFTDNRIYFENGVQQHLKLRGNNFKGFGTYTPNASRKYVAALSTSLITVDTGGDATQFADALETPSLQTWGDNVIRQAMLIARGWVAINGVPAAVFVGNPYNLQSCSRVGPGEVLLTFAKARASDDYQVVVSSRSLASICSCTAKTASGFTIKTSNLAGTPVDGDFDVIVA